MDDSNSTQSPTVQLTNTAHQTSQNRDKVDQVLQLKSEISHLIHNIRDSQTVCRKYSDENEYLQHYIGSVMKSGDLK